MSTEICKRQYEKIRAVLSDALHTRQSDVEAVINIANLNTPMTEDMVNLINDMHDAVRTAEKAIEDLDRVWNTRNWNTSDYAAYNLIIQNID